MTYASGGLIQATDYNNLINGTNQLNAVWSTGNGDAGYGQPAIPAVAAGNTVTAAQWASLINSLNGIRTHQTGAGSGITAPTAGTVITYLSTLQSGINSAYTGRASAATVGTTTTGTTNTTNSANAGATTAVTLTRTATATFASAQHARYFFNAGGKLGFVFTGGNLNGLPRSASAVTAISNLGSATLFNNKIQNSGAGDTAWGYRGLTTSPQQTRQVGATGAYTTTTATLYFFGTTDTTNGANGNTVSCRVTVSVPADNAFGGNCYFSLGMRCDITPPETTNLTNVWGTPTITFA